MNNHEKTILGKVLKAFGRVYEGVAVFGLFYSAIHPNPIESPKNAYISAAAGAAGMCLVGMGDAFTRYAKEMQEAENRDKIQKELEQIVRDENARSVTGLDIKAEDLGRLRAEQYMRTERRRG